MKTIDYTYFVLHQWYKDRFGEEDAPHFSAFIILTLCFCLNGLTLPIALDVLGFSLVPERAWQLVGGGILVVGVGMGYLLFLHNRRYERIIEAYRDASASCRARVLLAVYVAASFIAFILMGAIGTAQRAVVEGI